MPKDGPGRPREARGRPRVRPREAQGVLFWECPGRPTGKPRVRPKDTQGRPRGERKSASRRTAQNQKRGAGLALK